MKRAVRSSLILLVPLCLLLCAGCSAANQAGAPAPEKPVIVHLGPVAPDMLGITVREGRVEYGEQTAHMHEKGDEVRTDDASGITWIFRKGKCIGALIAGGTKIMTVDRVVGEKMDTAAVDRPETFAVTSPDDPDYAAGLAPLAIFRKSKPTDLARTGAGGLEAPREHTWYLKLPKPLKQGRSYVLLVKAAGLPEQKFLYEPASMRSEAVHVSHVGFRPDDPSKAAFLSLWAGSGGPVDFSGNRTFLILDDKSGETVFRGEARLSKRAAEKDEDAYNRNFNGADVYIMDFSALAKPGVYRVYVERVGCSDPFEIGSDVWRKAFYVSARGFYHQRSGVELGPPYTAFTRPRMFNPDDGVKVYVSKTPLMDTGNGFLTKKEDPGAMLLAGKTSGIVPNAWGGYCDAGDWDRRIQHLEAARVLIDLAEGFPSFFDRMELNIPKADASLPDIMNEALWGVDFFRRLQTPDGGIRGGIETESHPRYGEASWQNTLTVMAYAPDVWSSYLYAGAAARAYTALKRRGSALAGGYLESALRAMDWAEREAAKASPAVYPHQVVDARNLASAELFRATGSKAWHDLFVTTTVFGKQGVPLYLYEKHDQGEAAWVYGITRRTGMDASIKKNCIAAIIAEADSRIRAQAKTGFRWMKDPWRPAIAGTFTTPDCAHVIRAHIITGKKEYLEAVVLAAQTGAGANPLNICYTTGMGIRSPRHPLHIDSRIMRRPPPPGLTVLGPLDVDHLGGSQSPIHKYSGQFCYPDAKGWPVIENYWDVYWYPMMCEYTIHQSIAPNAYTWGYLAARNQD